MRLEELPAHGDVRREKELFRHIGRAAIQVLFEERYSTEELVLLAELLERLP